MHLRALAFAAFAALLALPHAADAKPKRKVSRPKPPPEAPKVNGLFISPFAEAADKSTSADLLTPGTGKVAVSVESTGEPQVIGHLSDEANNAVLGESSAQNQSTYKKLCETPCTLYVPPGHFFLSTGESASLSSMLEINDRNLNVRVRAPSRGITVASGLLLGFGGAGALGGAIMLPLGLSLPNVDPSLKVAGGVSLGVGLAMIIPGIILAILNRGSIEASESP